MLKDERRNVRYRNNQHHPGSDLLLDYQNINKGKRERLSYLA